MNLLADLRARTPLGCVRATTATVGGRRTARCAGWGSGGIGGGRRGAGGVEAMNESATMQQEIDALTELRRRIYAVLPARCSPDEMAVWGPMCEAHNSVGWAQRLLTERLRQEAGG